MLRQLHVGRGAAGSVNFNHSHDSSCNPTVSLVSAVTRCLSRRIQMSDEEVMLQKVTVLATFNPKDGQGPEVERVLNGMLRPTRGEPGCQRYDLYRTNGSRASFV